MCCVSIVIILKQTADDPSTATALLSVARPAALWDVYIHHRIAERLLNGMADF
jgi:hypothetical protein